MPWSMPLHDPVMTAVQGGMGNPFGRVGKVVVNHTAIGQRQVCLEMTALDHAQNRQVGDRRIDRLDKVQPRGAAKGKAHPDVGQVVGDQFGLPSGCARDDTLDGGVASRDQTVTHGKPAAPGEGVDHEVDQPTHEPGAPSAHGQMQTDAQPFPKARFTIEVGVGLMGNIAGDQHSHHPLSCFTRNGPRRPLFVPPSSELIRSALHCPIFSSDWRRRSRAPWEMTRAVALVIERI